MAVTPSTSTSCSSGGAPVYCFRFSLEIEGILTGSELLWRLSRRPPAPEHEAVNKWGGRSYFGVSAPPGAAQWRFIRLPDVSDKAVGADLSGLRLPGMVRSSFRRRLSIEATTVALSNRHAFAVEHCARGGPYSLLENLHEKWPTDETAECRGYLPAQRRCCMSDRGTAIPIGSAWYGPEWACAGRFTMAPRQRRCAFTRVGRARATKQPDDSAYAAPIATAR
jgi:hypothetical protein